MDGVDGGRDSSPPQLRSTMRLGREARIDQDGSRSFSNENSELVAVNEEYAHEDANEDSTDGMGAIVFTDEEYSGFFGKQN